jgi:sialate O-acetylesterase
VNRALFLLFFACSLQARLAVNGLFSKGAVLQQGMPIPVWGSADPGSTVTVALRGNSGTATSDKAGNWRLDLPAQQASNTVCELRISSANEVITRELWIGEVWLASGQSNMQYALRQTEDGKAAIPDANDPLLRVFMRSGRKRANWKAITPELAPGVSAVAYFFARQVRQTRKVPIGIIVRAVGGTTIQRWISPESWKENALITERVAAATARTGEFATLEAEKAKYDKRNPPLPAEAKRLAELGNLSYYRAKGFGGLYTRYIQPLQPFAIRGVIWYQGEFNNRPGQAADYGDWQQVLVDGWRKDWGQGDFPFLFVQMQVLGNGTTALLRESQASALTRCANSAMAVICDQSVGLHPPNKAIAGIRLAAAAESLAYASGAPPGGLTLSKATIEGSRMTLDFADVAEALTWKGEPRGFFICGPDQRFLPAVIETEPPARIILSHPAISAVVAARYAWQNDPRDSMALFNSVDLPASPFRTDTAANSAALDARRR